MPHVSTGLPVSFLVDEVPRVHVEVSQRLTLHAIRRAAERGIDTVSLAVVLRFGRAVRQLGQWRVSLVGQRRPQTVPPRVWSSALPVVLIESQSGRIITVFCNRRGAR